MRFALQVCGWAIGLPLELMIVAALLRGGGYRRYPFVLIFVIVDFLTTVAEIPYQIDYARGIARASTPLAPLFWIDELIAQILVYAVVLSLVYRVSRQLRSRRPVGMLAICGAVLIAAISFSVHYSPALNRGSWMTPWMRDLHFCSLLLDLGLWAVLIASRRRDHQILLLSGALGVKFAGESIGESVRQLAIGNRSRPLSMAGNLIMLLANLFFFYLWWQAARTTESTESMATKREPPAHQVAP
jgi:hypothetical protein